MREMTTRSDGINRHITIGVSSCLIGNKVRYDGNHKYDIYVNKTLGRVFELIALCPEVECGLSIPREGMHLVEDGESTRLVGIRSGGDHTDLLKKWVSIKLDEFADKSLSGFIFKAKSPSCGITDTKIYSSDTTLKRKGSGLFSGSFVNRFPLIPVIDEGRMRNVLLREDFLERVFVYKRWQDLVDSKPRAFQLVQFHSIHKFLIMAHNVNAVAKLGRIVASCKGSLKTRELDEYGGLLMKTLLQPATVISNVNVLQHMAGYFKKQLSHDQKMELQEVITFYQKNLVPLIVPITLLKHYTRLFKEPYLSTQVFLNPFPLELMI